MLDLIMYPKDLYDLIRIKLVEDLTGKRVLVRCLNCGVDISHKNSQAESCDSSTCRKNISERIPDLRENSPYLTGAMIIRIAQNKQKAKTQKKKTSKRGAAKKEGSLSCQNKEDVSQEYTKSS